MRRLFLFLISLALLGTAGYFLASYVIIPNLDSFGIVEYVILASVVLSLILTVVFMILFFYRNKDKKIAWLSSRLKQWTNLSVHVNRAGDEVFRYLPIGIIVYDQEMKIKWVNNWAKTIFNEELIEKPLSELNLGLYNYVSQDQSLNVVQVDNRYYEIIQKDDDKIIYLFDITEREIITQKYRDRTLAIGILSLDNIETETKKLDMQETAQIQSDFLGIISDWAAHYNGYLRNCDDVLMLIIDQLNLEKVMAEKFNILDQIRETSRKYNLRITMSMGFACGDYSFKELGQLAQNSLDLAEKRGGDQVVVNIVGDKIQYFGAKTNALEKNDFLVARANTLSLKEQIESSKEIYIMGHNQADADALGAMIGTYRMAQTSNKQTKIIMDYYRLDSTCQKIYEKFKEEDPGLLEAFIHPDALNNVSPDALLIIVDTQSPKIVMSEPAMYLFRKIAVIDHHRANDEGFADTVFSYDEPYASSSVELISEMFQFYQKDGIKINAFEATVMLAGIVVDTNNFTYRCGARTFEAASNLKALGANMIEVRRWLRNDLEQQVKLNKYVQKCDIILDKFGICQFDDDDVVQDRTILAKVADTLLTIDNIEASFVLANYEEGDISGVAISARSLLDVNVQVLMEEMGGGGHLNGAAAQITDKTLSQVRDELETILKRDFEVGEEKMKIILLEDVKGHGVQNQVIDVASGYANYLIVSKKAVLATDEALAKVKEQMREKELNEANQKKMMLKIKEEIENKSTNIYVKVGADGKLFGRVTTKQICDEFEAQTGIHLDKRKVSLPAAITGLGVYTANVDLYKDVEASFEINILAK